MPKPMGRPKKVDDKMLKELCAYLKAGNYLETSCAAIGLAKNTVYNCMRRGARDRDEGKSGYYVDFLYAVESAMAQGESNHVNNIAAHAKKSWQASAWMLERKNHKKWGRKETVRNEDGDTPKEQSDMTSGESLNELLAPHIEEAEKDRYED